MIREDSLDGVVCARYDYDAGMVTVFNEDGSESGTRPLTQAEVVEGHSWVAEQSAAAAQSTAAATLSTLATQVEQHVSQAQADAAAWPTADATARDEIMQRVLLGLAQITQALGELGVHLGIKE